MIYLASTTDTPAEFGVMFSAKKSIGGLTEALKSDRRWMMDNNAFSGGFDAHVWLRALLRYLPYKQTCVGIPVPDMVGDAFETLRAFSHYWRIVRELGYPVAFVTQDGITPALAPWDYFDVLFVGGTDAHKLGPEAGAMIAEARERGKWIHIGRVNSPSRIRDFWMADSVDGTHLTIEFKEREKSVKAIADAVCYCVNRKSGRVGVNGQYQIAEVMA